MPQFPVSDPQAVVDGLNYLLSGPSNLGQGYQGFSSNTVTPLGDQAFDLGTGKLITVTPIESNTVQLYLTDCQARVGVQGGQDRVVLSGQLNTSIEYTSTQQTGVEYTVSLNRYRAYPNDSTTYNDYLFYYEKTLASHVYNYSVDATTGAIVGLTPTGTKIAYIAPSTGAIKPAVQTVLTNLDATTGTGFDASIEISIAYGTAGSYNSTNTALNVINPGSGWTAGSTIVIPGDLLGAATPANDLTITVDSVSTGSSTRAIDYETIFTGIIDDFKQQPTGKPAIGFYLYVIQVEWLSIDGGITIDTANLGVRSISAQVLKQ
jgi:hypothetical protein